ncbi:MAG: SDR family NAD(P)-dependent oxidoreductase [Planctomycetaceae bacterium]
MSQRLLNKVAVITGAGSGIGRAIAERFLTEGAKIVIIGRNRGPLEEVASLAAARVLAVEADVSDASALRNVAAATVRRFGAVDVLIPNAGIAQFTPLLEASPDAVRAQFETNLIGALQTVQEFASSLRSGSSILFLTAAPGLTTATGLGAHAASKAATRALAMALAVEFAPKQIRVNCVAPGPTTTAFWRSIEKRGSGRKSSALKQAGLPAPEEFRSPHDVAEAAVFLASDAANHIGGQEFVIDQ